MRVAFAHPDLGIGGAERLVVDAALELQSRGHGIEIFTAHHDSGHCFAETRDGTLPRVRVHGDWLPRHICGKGHALFASLRCLVVAVAIYWSGKPFDAIFVDQVSTVISVLKLLMPTTKILFYCHFPDLLLAKKGGWLKRLYRWPLDALEQCTTGQADLILVNSAFTAGVFAQTFTQLHAKGIRPVVLHPSVEIPSATQQLDAANAWRTELPEDLVQFLTNPGTRTFLSINRFEKKKGIELAVHALHKLKSVPSEAPLEFRPSEMQPQFVIAGGYDNRVKENRQVFEKLKRLVHYLALEASVYFVKSFTDRQKQLLLSASTAVVYTPQDEHFGIVPLESMAFERPVIACDSGGPVESILDGRTGFLASPTPEAFADSMRQLLSFDAAKSHQMGQLGRQHVEENFSRSVFGQRLTDLLTDLVKKKQN